MFKGLEPAFDVIALTVRHDHVFELEPSGRPPVQGLPSVARAEAREELSQFLENWRSSPVWLFTLLPDQLGDISHRRKTKVLS